ncbi:MAG TPA: hypothetical protein VGC70_08610, partial [Burkholderiales bacterium]
LFWLYMPLHIGLNIGALVYFGLKGRGRPIIRAKRDALRGLRRIWSERKKVQADRRVSSPELNRLIAGVGAVFKRR